MRFILWERQLITSTYYTSTMDCAVWLPRLSRN